VGDQDESLASHICCLTFVRLLTGWVNGLDQMPFAILLIQLLLLFDKYNRHTSKSKHAVKYHNLPSTYSEELPAAQPLENLTSSDYNSDFDEDHGQQEGDNTDCDLTFEARCSLSEPHLTQGNLNNPICDLVHLKNKLNS